MHVDGDRDAGQISRRLFSFGKETVAGRIAMNHSSLLGSL